MSASASSHRVDRLLRAVNTIADRIRGEWPHVAVDTLAYTYTRPCPKVTRPRQVWTG